MQITLTMLADVLEESFDREDCSEERAIRNITESGLVDGRKKSIARKILEKLADQEVCYAFNELSGISKKFKLAKLNTRDAQRYRFFRYNSAFVQS